MQFQHNALFIFQNETYITETLSMTRPLQEKGATSH